MEPMLPRLLLQAAPRASSRASRTLSFRRAFGNTATRGIQQKPYHESDIVSDASYAQPAHKVSQNVTEEERDHYDKMLEHSKDRQMKSPWMREGSDKPPVARQRSAGAMTKGKLLTTPSRMLKLILPLTTRDFNKDRKDVEPLALLVHPQQPLSYLERLIQSELPTLKDGDKEKIPKVVFRAEDSAEDSLQPDKRSAAEDEEMHKDEEELSASHKTYIGGKLEKTGKISGGSSSSTPSGSSGQTGAENKDDREDPDRPNFVRWSPSTEIGDFIRDAARGKEFSVDIEGAPSHIYVGVPSFDDRTYYLRMRLRKTAKRIATMADIKQECDKLAHRAAQNVAKAGFAGLVGWWYLVYRLTFETDLGWDVMEPVTYLVGLSTLIGGYMWFLYHNREVSYQSAMNFTKGRRQEALYKQRGFKVHDWDTLVEVGNQLRREIKMVADEYDVDWDERADEGHNEKVALALRQERKKKKQGKEDEDEDDDEDGEEGKGKRDSGKGGD